MPRSRTWWAAGRVGKIERVQPAGRRQDIPDEDAGSLEDVREATASKSCEVERQRGVLAGWLSGGGWRCRGRGQGGARLTLGLRKATKKCRALEADGS